MVKAVFFDLGDTLCDYQAAAQAGVDAACEYAVNHAEELNADGLRDAYAREARHAADEAKRWTASRFTAGSGLDEEGYRKWQRALEKCGVANPILAHAVALHYQLSRMRALTLFPDALPALQALKRRACLGLICEGSPGIVHEEINLLDIRDLFSVVAVEGEAGYTKSDPHIFAHALREAACAPAHAAYVGDSLDSDIAPAHEAGLVTVWVNRADEEPPPEAPGGPDHIVTDLLAVPELLLSSP